MGLKNKFEAGWNQALAVFKVGNLTAGAAAYNPGLSSGNTPTAPSALPMTVPKSTIPSTAPMASAASKSNVLG